ncbi:MAG: hypothetical protein NZ557_15900 [Chthonomonadaceae bacterium]|nr:hypothetical protein [Chthonomonadaceae bacterium]
MYSAQQCGQAFGRVLQEERELFADVYEVLRRVASGGVGVVDDGGDEFVGLDGGGGVHEDAPEVGLPGEGAGFCGGAFCDEGVDARGAWGELEADVPGPDVADVQGVEGGGEELEDLGLFFAELFFCESEGGGSASGVHAACGSFDDDGVECAFGGCDAVGAVGVLIVGFGEGVAFCRQCVVGGGGVGDDADEGAEVRWGVEAFGRAVGDEAGGAGFDDFTEVGVHGYGIHVARRRAFFGLDGCRFDVTWTMRAMCGLSGMGRSHAMRSGMAPM